MPPRTRNYKWLIGPIVSLCIVAIGWLGGWYTLRANVVHLEKQQSALEQTTDRHEVEIVNIKVKDASQTQVIVNIHQLLNKIEAQTQKIPQIQADISLLKESR